MRQANGRPPASTFALANSIVLLMKSICSLSDEEVASRLTSTRHRRWCDLRLFFHRQHGSVIVAPAKDAGQARGFVMCGRRCGGRPAGFPFSLFSDGLPIGKTGVELLADHAVH